jgi:protein gp37
MASYSGIEWTEATWNPITGCTKISAGCKNCYAERMAHRLQAMGNPHYANGFCLTLHEDTLGIPLRWRKPRMIFVNSMSDLFHEDVTHEFVQRIFDVMRQASWHTYQILTKRSSRLLELSGSIDWPVNAWMGVSVENEDYLYRVDDLRQIGAHTRFLSLEPLLGPLHGLNLDGIDWVIVGGESGPHARPMKTQWAVDVKNQSRAVPFFFKQWGGMQRKRNGRMLQGRTWDQMPTTDRVSARRALQPAF